MPNLKINNKTYTGVTEVHIPLADGSGNEDFAYINDETKRIITNGTHDVKHYGTVNVNVPTGGGGITPTGTKTITANGTYDVTEYASANVAVPSKEPTIRSLSITANGTYTAPSGVDGYSPISVNVPTGGGGIDTSDATATDDDIEEGKTAYVNGVKVTGTLSELDMISAENVSDFRATMNCYIVASQSPRKGIVQAGGLVGLKTAPSLFGNCKPEDVRQGVTFTSENGLRAAGTLVVESGGGGGIDTSDATATANDMAQGATAYVKGQKITGALRVAEEDSIIGGGFATWDDYGDGVAFCGTPTTFDMVARAGCLPIVEVPYSVFGNASASDVVAGKTFTSVNGLKITGTASLGGGGLPAGVSALASGTYTPSEDKTSRVDVDHGLGVTPNFLVVMMEDDTSNSVLSSSLVGAAVFFKKTKYNDSSTIVYDTHITMEGYGSNSMVNGSATRAASNAYFTTTTVGIPCNSTYKLKTGHTYRWVCGVMDNIQ